MRIVLALALALLASTAWAGDFTSPGSRAQSKAEACERIAGNIDCRAQLLAPSILLNGNPTFSTTTGAIAEILGTNPGVSVNYTATGDAIPGPGAFVLYSTNAGTTGPVLGIYQNSSTPAAADDVGQLAFYGNDDGGVGDDQLYARLVATIVSTNNADERGQLDVEITGDAGQVVYIFDDVGLTLPLNDNGGGPVLAMASTGVINFNAGDVTLTHATDELAIAGGSLKLANGTATVEPLNLPSGTLETTSEDGDIEADANAMYGSTDGGNRGYIPLRHVVYADGTNTLTSSVAEQALFTAANDTITLETGTYKFECYISLTAMSATSGNAAFDPLGAGTATVGSWMWHTQAVDGASATLATWQNATIITQQTPASAATAGTATEMQFACDGTFEVTGAGTMIPSITLVTAAAAVVRIGSHFIFERIGGASPTSIGQWN